MVTLIIGRTRRINIRMKGGEKIHKVLQDIAKYFWGNLRRMILSRPPILPASAYVLPPVARHGTTPLRQSEFVKTE